MKVLRDMTTERGEAEASGSAQALAVAKENHKYDAKQFLCRSRSSGSHKFRPRKFRKTSHEMLIHTHHNIKLVMQNGGLEAHVIEAAERVNPTKPYEWPLLHITWDKSAETICSANFLRNFMNLNVIFNWDTDHGAYRSEQEAITSCGLMCHETLMCMAYDCSYGEWKDGTRGEQVKTAAKDSLRVLSPAEDVPWQHCLPMILRNKGINAALLTSEKELDLRRDMLAECCWDFMLPKLTFNKFDAPLQRFKQERPIWGERQYGLLTACMDLNLAVKQDERAPAPKAKAKPKAKASAVGAKKEAYAIKKAKGHPVRFAYEMYADVDNLYKQEIISRACEYTSMWRSVQNGAHTSVEGTFRWRYLQVGGRYMEHVVQTMGVCGSAVRTWSLAAFVPRHEDRGCCRC